MFCPTPPRANVAREPGQERPRFVNQSVRRIDHEKPGARERLLAVRANGRVADVEFKPQDVWRAERGDRIQEMGVDSSFADRTPGDKGPNRPFA